MPVLIDFGGVKQVEVTVVSKFTNLGKLHTRLGKKGYAQRNSGGDRASLSQQRLVRPGCNSTGVADGQAKNCMTIGNLVATGN